MKRFILCAVMILSVAIFAGCDLYSRIFGPNEPGKDDVWYFNSFETSKDLEGWKGLSPKLFRHDVPPGGGKQAILISGGCVVPHASYELTAPSENSRLHIRCWAKLLATGGIISLTNVADRNEAVSISVTDTVWTKLQSEQALNCRPGEKIRIELMSGGFVAGGMLVDNIEVIVVHE